MRSKHGAVRVARSSTFAAPFLGAAAASPVSVVNPTLYFVSALREALIGSGIEVRGAAAVDVDDPADPSALNHRTPVLTYQSPPLSELAVTMMKVSQNLFAETLLQAAVARPLSARR